MKATINKDRSAPYIDRILSLPPLLDKKSHFLFGPRQTGKTSLIHHTMKEAKVYDLLDTSIFLALSRDPGRIAQEVNPQDRLIVIDEIQRLPELLNEVHRLIEARGIRFLMTGSSARKIRRGGINLLGGRARTKQLHPLTRRELGERFDLTRAIQRPVPSKEDCFPRSIFPMIPLLISSPTLGYTSNRRSWLKEPFETFLRSAGS